ncbi:hypothetical protein M673_23183 (plasmid) [Aureimonas sp. AU20]|nr:hypothetical protein M673_23183 [Aureimonas sp. AU20]
MRNWLCVGAALLSLASPASGMSLSSLAQIARPAASSPAPMTPIPDKGVRVAQACCKTCSKGKACGDSCISREKQCHKGQGCACDQ